MEASMGTSAPSTSDSVRRKIIRILHLVDTLSDSELCRKELKNSQFEASVEVVRTAEQFSSHLSGKQYDVILADYQLQGWNGMHAFEIFRKSGCKAPFILVTGAIGEVKVAESMREGVSDFVFKHDLASLSTVVIRSLRDQQLRDERERSA